MNFKEVRLVGFKSFADKTSIKFDDGVTCIVGPNGCGKSNVADAVRWVLGEQSAKTLRGSSMQDVIFGGTEARRQLSYCEVTLVFDNKDKLFDIEYDEVAMTRRLYRSGESEYLLNMQPCRLKDIVALLHGVGIGKEGYSIIGQGKVEQIMNAKPEERRIVFEEATGVMQFKLQKGDIERKLENARDNLTVFSQRMDETEKMLRPLEEQAETAKKYREYSERLRYEEINAYLVRSDSFANETAKFRARIDDASARLSEIETRLAAVDAEQSESRDKIARADDALRSLNEKLRLFEVDMEHKSGEARVLDTNIRAYRRELDRASEEVAYSLRRTKDIDALVAASAKKTASDEQRAQEIEREAAALQKKLEEADARVAAYEKITGEKRAHELSSVEDLADVRANVGSLSAKRDAAKGRIGEVNQAIQKAKEREKTYTEQLNSCLAEKKARVDFLDGKDAEEARANASIGELSRREEELSQKIVDCNTSVANLSNNLEMYRDLKNRFNGYRDAVRRLQLDAKNDPALAQRIKGTIADIVSTEKKYEVAVETAFGPAMQYLVTATLDDAQYLVDYLKHNRLGVVTFLPVSYMRPRGDSREAKLACGEVGAIGLAGELVKYDPYYENAIRNSLDNTLICDTLGNAKRIALKYPRAFRLVTLEGDVIAANGSVTGGSQRRESGNLLAGERLIKECEEGIARKRAEGEKLTAALAACRKQLADARAEYENFRVRVQEETAAFAAVSQREIAIRDLIHDAQTDAEEYAALLAKLSRTVDDLESEVHISAESEALLNKIRTEAAQEAQAREEEIGSLKARRDSVAAQLHDLRVEGAGVASGKIAEAENVRRLTAEKTELLRKVEQTRQNIAKTEQLIEQLKRDEERAALTEEEQRTVAALRDRLGEAEEEKRAVSEAEKKLDEEKRSLLTAQMRVSEERHAAEIEISRAETNLDNMKQRIEETYGLDYESANAMRDPEYDSAQANANINSLKHKMNALGDVNQKAEEDYANLLARYTDMQTQREDLEKGIADLTGVLNDLRDEMQKQFDAGFQEINENFSRIFKELFGGGRAEMQLDYTDCDDPLNAGVEIIACPPGKKLTKISLLSGGERAFTAIAILFAILKSRPMPFCILDEIEAALDEANVERFAKYLKKFSRDTQFIVITHRKPTMNQADTLFGVTMEEKGVSKIVSVKLSEVESRLGGDTVQ